MDTPLLYFLLFGVMLVCAFIGIAHDDMWKGIGWGVFFCVALVYWLSEVQQ